jgi:type IV pilus assembly protein PilC
MILQPRLSNKALTELCHRLSVETESGIDIRRTWQREAENAPARFRPYFARIRDRLGRGDSLTLALAEAGPVFPSLFREMAEIGEETGTFGRVMQRLEGHYRRLVEARRTFLAASAWPMIELGLALSAIGALIFVMGMLPRQDNGRPVDILGFGLIGAPGLITYVTILIAIAIGLVLLVGAMRRGVLWTRPLQRALIRLPVFGPCLEKLALSRMAWALHLAMNVEMDLRRVVPLALRATGNDYYIRHTAAIVSSIGSGRPLVQALARTGAFPATLIDTLAVGEETGQIVESMERLANRYEKEAETAVKVLSTLAGVAVFLLVAALIIWLIFHIYVGFYLKTINDAMKGI